MVSCAVLHVAIPGMAGDGGGREGGGKGGGGERGDGGGQGGGGLGLGGGGGGGRGVGGGIDGTGGEGGGDGGKIMYCLHGTRNVVYFRAIHPSGFPWDAIPASLNALHFRVSQIPKFPSFISPSLLSRGRLELYPHAC